ncbi:universal stress protein [Lysobacter xanthus]
MKDVLVRAQSLDPWDEGVTAAAGLARTFAGGLTAVHVVPVGLPPLSPYDPGMLAAAAALEMSRQLREAQARAGAFTAWATAIGAREPAWICAAGDAAHVIREAAAWHDLLVVRLDRADIDPWAGPGGVGRIVVNAGVPVMVLPPGASPGPDFETVAVAWDGSPCAARALHGAQPFLARAGRVVVLDGARRALPPLAPGPDLARWCARNLPRAEIRPIEAGDGGDGTGAALLAAVETLDAGLLVMGAWGHARLSEWVLGGVTRHVLAHATRPVLMRH